MRRFLLACAFALALAPVGAAADRIVYVYVSPPVPTRIVYVYVNQPVPIQPAYPVNPGGEIVFSQPQAPPPVYYSTPTYQQSAPPPARYSPARSVRSKSTFSSSCLGGVCPAN